MWYYICEIMIFLLYLYNFVTNLTGYNLSREWITHLPIEEVM